MPVGKMMIYEAKTEDGAERVEIVIPGDTKKIMGVETLLHHETVYLEGQLREDTKDYIAQDKDGNVWYFGERWTTTRKASSRTTEAHGGLGWMAQSPASG